MEVNYTFQNNKNKVSVTTRNERSQLIKSYVRDGLESTEIFNLVRKEYPICKNECTQKIKYWKLKLKEEEDE